MDMTKERTDLLLRARIQGSIAGAVGALVVAALVNRPGIGFVLALGLFECLVNQPHFFRLLPVKLSLKNQVRIHLFADVLVMTAVIHFLGGYHSGPLVASYLFLMLFASATLGWREGAGTGLVGLTALVLMTVAEIRGWIGPPPPFLSQGFELGPTVATFIIVAFLFLMPAVVGERIFKVILDQEQSLTRSVERYQRLLREIGEAVLVVNPDGTIYEANHQAARLFQREQEWLYGKIFTEVLSPESAEEFAVLIGDVTSGEKVKAKNWKLPLPDGSERVIEVNASPYPRDPEPAAVFMIIRDVTEQDRLECELRTYSSELELRVEARTAELEESWERYWSLFEKAAVPLCWLDPNGVLRSGNKTFYELTGLAKDDEGRLQLVRLLPDWKDQERVAEYLVLHRKGYDAPTRLELAVIRPDGGERFTEWFLYFNPLTDQILVSIIDITARKQAADALKESEERYRRLVATSPDSITLSDHEGKVVMINQQGLDLYGASSERELLGVEVFDLIVPEDRDRARANVAPLLANGSIHNVIYRFCRKDGSSYSGELNASVIPDAKGEPAAVVSVVRDVTERIRADEALKVSEERYRRLVETSPDSIVVSDLTGKVIMANRQGMRMYGAETLEEILGLNAFEFIAPEDRERAAANAAVALEQGQVRDLEYRILRKDGSTYPGEVSASLIRDAQGKPLAFLGVTRDITERKRVEEALRDSEERYRSLIAASPDPIIVTGRDGRIQMVSRQALNFYGTEDEADMIGRDIYEMIAAEDRKQARDNSITMLKTGELLSREHTLLRRDGSPYLGEISSTVIKDARGEPVAFMNVIRDITARRRAEEALLESEERYRSTIDSMADMIHVMDPEFRILFFNKAFERINRELHLGRAEPGAKLQEAFPFLGPEIFEQYRQVFETGEPVTTEESNIIGGREIYTESRKIPILEKGRVTRVVTVIRDISRRKRAEQELEQYQARLEDQVRERTAELRRSEESYRLLAENITDVIYTADFESLRTTYVSPSVENIRGFTANEVMSQTLDDILMPHSKELILKVLAEELALEQSSEKELVRPRLLEVEQRCKDGSTVWTEDKVLFLRDQDQKPVAVLGVSRDITKRKWAEQALVESEKRYRFLADNISDVIWTVSLPDLKVTYVSPSVTRQRGFSVEETMSHTPEKTLPPESLGRAMKIFAEEMAREDKGGADPGRSRVIELERYCKDGTIIWTEDTLTFLRDPEGKAVGVLGVSRNVTERKKTEEALRKSEETYRLLADNVTDVIWVIEVPALRPVYVSPSITRQRGFTPEELIALPQDKITTPASQAAAMKMFAEELALEKEGKGDPGRSRIIELECYCKDGSTIWTEDTITALRDPDGRIAGALSVSRDITERRKAQEALRKSEELYRLLADNVTDVIWVVELPSLRPIYISPSVTRQRGFTPEEAMAMMPDRAATSESWNQAMKLFAEEMARDQAGDRDPSRTVMIELERYCKDGTTVWTEDTVTAIRDGEGKLVGALGVSREISERKRVELELARYRDRLEDEVEERTAELLETNTRLMEEIGERARAETALKESEERFRTMIENASDMISILDASGKILYISPAVRKIFGFSPEKMVGQNALDFSHPDDLPGLGQQLERGLAARRGRAVMEFRVQHKDGSWRTVEAVFTNLLDDPRIGGLVVNSRDITERRLAEEAVRESEARLRSFLQHSPDFIAILDRDAKIIFLNRSASANSVDDVIGRNGLDYLPPEYQEELRQLLGLAFADEITTRPLTVNALGRVFEVRVVPLRSGGRVESVMGIATDVTARKEAERARAELTEMLNRSERMAAVGQIAAGVVHEMNSPLTAVIYYAEALARLKTIKKAEKEKILRIQESADRIQKLLARVMNYASTRDVEMAPVQLNALVRQVMDAISHELEKRPQAKIVLDLRDDPPEIRGATDQLFELVSNLVINALQSLGKESGKITVATRAEDRCVIFEVQDTGAGIEPQDLEKIFNPFFSRRRAGEGTGLGLAIVKRVADLHHAAIAVASTPGTGTTFTVRFPII